MSTKAFHEQQIRLAVRDKLVAEKRLAATMLMFEAAAMQGDPAQQERERERARVYVDLALDATARSQEHATRMINAKD